MTKTETYVTLPCLAGRLGLQHYQVAYWVRTGASRAAPCDQDGSAGPGPKRRRRRSRSGIGTI